MKKILLSFLFICALFGSSAIKAQEFFDSSDATKFFTFSGRVGFNTSNQTFPSTPYLLWNHNSWGTGFNVGALANLNFKEYLTLQPGIFYESRSGNYSYLSEYIDYNNNLQTHYQLGHIRGYYITVPIMGVVKFNIADNIKWMVEFGPYLQFSLKQKGQDDISVIYRMPQSEHFVEALAKRHSFDFGFKMGTGLRFYDHYYIGVHYLAGVCNVWNVPSGGKNKSWEFSLGYDF